MKVWKFTALYLPVLSYAYCLLYGEKVEDVIVMFSSIIRDRM